MPLDSHQQQPQPSVGDMKVSGESQTPTNCDEVMAGTKVIMTHAERQAFLKTSRLGHILGVSHLLPEVGEVKEEVQKESSRLTCSDLHLN